MCGRCADHGITCVPQTTGSRKVCQPCTIQKTACTFTGHTVPSRSVDPEVIREVVENTMRPFTARVVSSICSQKWAMEEMSVELFGKNMGHTWEDWEWAEAEEVLRNWHEWGKPGTSYGHLPVVEERLLRRVDSPEPPGSETVSEDKLAEVKMTRRRMFGERVEDKSESEGEDEDEIVDENEGEDDLIGSGEEGEEELEEDA